MIKSRLLLLAALTCSTAQAEDANTFYFTDAAVLPGETTNIELCMRNAEKSLTCLEAEIQLPEGLSVALDEKGNPIVTLYRNRTEGHEVLRLLLSGKASSRPSASRCWSTQKPRLTTASE